MGTIRREAISALEQIKHEAVDLACLIEHEMYDALSANDLVVYQSRAAFIRQSLDRLDKQLTLLKDIT